MSSLISYYVRPQRTPAANNRKVRPIHPSSAVFLWMNVGGSPFYVTRGGLGGRGQAAWCTCWLAWEFHVRHHRLSANNDVIVSLCVCLSVCVSACLYTGPNDCTLRPVRVIPTCLLVMCLYSFLYSILCWCNAHYRTVHLLSVLLYIIE